MSVLSVRNLAVTFIENNLFSDISFEIEARDKVGLIGANGVGKTTIFKIINGQLTPTVGDVFISKDLTVGYMEQHACTHPNRSVYKEVLSVFDYLKDMEQQLESLACEIESNEKDRDELIIKQTRLIDEFHHSGGLEYKNRARSVLLGLGFNEEDFVMPTGKLSGGQRSKVSLAKLLLLKADLLLLDEPTNHLDIDAVAWLEGFIKDFNGAVLIISHDRYFLDAVTNKVIEIEHKKAMSYTGNYSQFIKKKQLTIDALESKYKNDLKEINRIEGIIEQQKRWNRQKNLVTAHSKQKQVDKIKEQLVSPDGEVETVKFNFVPNRESGNDVLICRNISKSFKEEKLFSNANIHITKGEKVFIIGANGSGKTTLFKILTGEYKSDSGEIKLGAKVDLGYFDQMQANLDLTKNAVDEIWDSFPNLTQTRVRTALGSFLFKGDDVFKTLSKMSGGERARVSLLKLMLSGDNFLLLDEPTNHLDTQSREQLETTLKEYDGTMLIISHDRYFINKLADRILALTKDGLKEYLGNYDNYLEKTKEIQDNIIEKNKEEKQKVNEYQLKKQEQAKQRKIQTQLKKTEETIELLDQEINNTQQMLQDEDIISDYEKIMELTQSLEQLNKEQEQAYINWETLHNGELP